MRLLATAIRLYERLSDLDLKPIYPHTRRSIVFQQSAMNKLNLATSLLWEISRSRLRFVKRYSQQIILNQLIKIHSTAENQLHNLLFYCLIYEAMRQ